MTAARLDGALYPESAANGKTESAGATDRARSG
jgi:hypothetical protein